MDESDHLTLVNVGDEEVVSQEEREREGGAAGGEGGGCCCATAIAIGVCVCANVNRELKGYVQQGHKIASCLFSHTPLWRPHSLDGPIRGRSTPL